MKFSVTCVCVLVAASASLPAWADGLGVVGGAASTVGGIAGKVGNGANTVGNAAADPTGTAMGAASSAAGHPCMQLKVVATKACKDAGFTLGGHKNGNKGLIDDCMKPIMTTGTVPDGVTVDPNLVSACQAKKSGGGK